ncbi:PPOX class F420-dependent oxidoreductase [Nonomuraea sp. NPDC050383]|uniref:PPOX class F420-dependent oxidoreductase n=1 Tax=Nonomuraea sp. NPDC050383 TaxID=3364362 RepID=UPI003791F9AB
MPGAAAPIMAASSVSGLLSGWLYGLRRHRAPEGRQLVVATAWLTATGLLLPLAPSAFWLGAAVVVTEATVPPTLVLLNVLTEKAVHPAARTQAFTWNNSAGAAGSALAASLAGRAADGLGPSAALALAPAAGLVLLLLASVPRRDVKLPIMSVTLSDSAKQILDAANIGVLATLNPDGSPQTSVVWVGTDGADVVISSQAGRRKVVNLERDPRASLSVFDLSDPERYVEIRGVATVTEDEGRRLAVELAEKYEGEGAGEDYLRLPAEAVRVVIRITPQRVAGNAV